VKSIHHPSTAMHPYSELINVVQESASDLVEHQMTRDRQRFFYEKQKLALLIVLILSLWIMFFLLWGRLDELIPSENTPAAEPQMAPHRDSHDPTSPYYVI
jgi:hypothetical protein